MEKPEWGVELALEYTKRIKDRISEALPIVSVAVSARCAALKASHEDKSF